MGATPQNSQPPRGPVTRTERIASIDTLRGIALLSILLSNIDIFSGPETFFELPQGLPDTSFMNGHLHLNLFLLFFKWITTEGKARFLFSILFGIGLCLMTERAERMDRTGSLADIYLRRNFWLCVLGLLHGILIWAGDILLSYGLAGLLILYPCRKLRAHLGSRTAGHVFQSRVGTPLENRDICRRILKPLCKSIGITPGGMHAFRRGRVSHLQQSGVPADFTKNQVGHSSLRTTSGYTHFSADFARNTVERLASELPSWTHSGKLDSVAAKTN